MSNKYVLYHVKGASSIYNLIIGPTNDNLVSMFWYDKPLLKWEMSLEVTKSYLESMGAIKVDQFDSLLEIPKLYPEYVI